MTALQIIQLGSIAQINPNLGDVEYPSDEIVDFVPMSAIDAGMSLVSAQEARPYAEVKKGYTCFADGDILLAKITPCFENGKISQIRIKTNVGFGSTEFHVVRPNTEKLDARYLVHFLRQDRIRIEGERRMTGSAGQRRVPKRFLESLPIFLPPLPEQRRIAGILDRADALGSKRREALAHLDGLAQSIFVDMFGDPATNPKNWPVRTLKELGKVTTGGTPPSSLDGMFGGVIPFVTPGDLESDQPVRRTVTEAGAQEVGTVRAGTALVCCIGATIGKIGLATVRSSFNQQLNGVEWFREAIDDLYGLAALRFFRPTIISWGASTTLPILKKSSFERVAIPVPPLYMQQEFARRSRSLGTLEERMRGALGVGSCLFAALEQRAFRGEL